MDFNPRAPRGARRESFQLIDGRVAISIHAPLAGRDASTRARRTSTRNFNPRAPRGARPFAAQARSVVVNISIHAPLAGRDFPFAPYRKRTLTFQSTRPSRGATTYGSVTMVIEGVFQSTRPSRGATANVHKNHVHICANTQKKYVFLSNTVCQSA